MVHAALLQGRAAAGAAVRRFQPSRAWIDRVKIPGGGRVLAHTHSHDELVTVIEGTWYLGKGKRFDPAKLKGYPAGSFIVIPGGVPHFAAAQEGAVIVQLSGVGRFNTDYLEK